MLRARGAECTWLKVWSRGLEQTPWKGIGYFCVAGCRSALLRKLVAGADVRVRLYTKTARRAKITVDCGCRGVAVAGGLLGRVACWRKNWFELEDCPGITPGTAEVYADFRESYKLAALARPAFFLADKLSIAIRKSGPARLMVDK